MSDRSGLCQRIKNYDGGAVSRTLLEDALEYFISIEPDPGKDVDYEAYMAGFGNDECFVKSTLVLRRFGEQVSRGGISEMQEVFYAITGSPKFLGENSRCVIARAWLMRAWDGIGEWKR